MGYYSMSARKAENSLLFLFLSYLVDPRAECGGNGLSSVPGADCLQGLCSPMKCE